MSCLWETNPLAKEFWENGRAATCPVYDMHGHMGSHYAIYLGCCEAPEMVAHMRRIGVKKFFFSHHHVLFGLMRNAEVVEICKQYPDILRMYVAINPNYPDHIREDLANFESWRPYAVGLKILPDYHKFAANAPEYEFALKFADEHGLPVLCHTWGGSVYNGGPIMLEVAQRYPHAKFFMGHAIYGDAEYSRRVVTDAPGNVWLELTSIPGERGYIERLVGDVGSERILYGTDMPWFDEYQAVGGVLAANISEDDMRNILYRNAERIFGKDC